MNRAAEKVMRQQVLRYALSVLVASVIPGLAQADPVAYLYGPVGGDFNQVFLGDGTTPDNAASAAGTKIFDLAGSAVADDGSPVHYTTSFVATGSSSLVTFAFRNDNGYFGFDNASVSALSGGPNLLTDPGFDDASDFGTWQLFTQTNFAPVGALGQYGAFNVYMDDVSWDTAASNGGYDGIAQTINTIAGQTYSIAYDLEEGESGNTFYQQTSSSGSGSAVDMVVFATKAAPVTDVAEPASIAILGVAVAGIAMVRYKRPRPKRRCRQPEAQAM